MISCVIFQLLFLEGNEVFPPELNWNYCPFGNINEHTHTYIYTCIYLHIHMEQSWKGKTHWDRLRPGILYYSSCTWPKVSSSSKIQRNYKGLKIAVHMLHSWGKWWTRRYKKIKTQLTLLKSRSTSRVLCMPPALNTAKRLGESPKPPLWSGPRHTLHPHPI